MAPVPQRTRPGSHGEKVIARGWRWRVAARAGSTPIGEAPRDRRPRARGVILGVCTSLATACVFGATRVGLSDASHVPLAAAPPATHAAHTTAALSAGSPPTLQVITRPLAGRWTVAARVGRAAAWLTRRSGVTLMRVDERLVHLSLHAGWRDGGKLGWTYGDRVAAREAGLLVAAVNGVFKLNYTNVGFMSGGHVAVALKAGLASIVTYSDGTTNIGAWQAGVPSSRKTVFSVLQNQWLLVDRGAPAATVSSCGVQCWGGTVGLRSVVARSGLGITANGQLVWAAGEHLSPRGLAAALIAAGAVRAIELDINPWWVAGYAYIHHPGGTSPISLVSGQRGIAGAFLKPYSRDFLAFVAN